MRLLILIFLVVISIESISQITAVQQKAFNSYVDYANQSSDEVNAVMQRIIEYYPTIHQKKSWGEPRFVCPVQLDEYYFKAATDQNKALPPTSAPALTAKLRELRDAAEKIDGRCKALDTYHKLEDYKQDNFAKAETIINELQLLVLDYRKKRNALQQELEASYKKLVPAAGTAYQKADEMMRTQIANEKAFLDTWTFNLKPEVHTDWSLEKIEQSILDTDAQLKAFQKYKPALQYPASSMWTSFQSNLASVLTTKRDGLDGYNFEAKKSDKHTNSVYLGLINYVNGTLVADYNMFLQYAEQNNYRGLKVMTYVPAFEIKTQPKAVAVDVKQFKDIPRKPVAMSPIKTAIPKPTYQALLNYIDYVNETWRQTRRLYDLLRSFNSSASYYKNVQDYKRVGGMSFKYEDFQVPLSFENLVYFF